MPIRVKIDKQLCACAKDCKCTRTNVRRNVRPDLAHYAALVVIESLEVRHAKDGNFGNLQVNKAWLEKDLIPEKRTKQRLGMRSDCSQRNR